MVWHSMVRCIIVRSSVGTRRLKVSLSRLRSLAPPRTVSRSPSPSWEKAPSSSFPLGFARPSILLHPRPFCCLSLFPACPPSSTSSSDSSHCPMIARDLCIRIRMRMRIQTHKCLPTYLSPSLSAYLPTYLPHSLSTYLPIYLRKNYLPAYRPTHALAHVHLQAQTHARTRARAHTRTCARTQARA